MDVQKAQHLHCLYLINKKIMTKEDTSLGYFRRNCRMCHSTDLHMFLDFGMHPHSDGFIKPEKIDEAEQYFPLACNICKKCGQIQLSYTVKPEYLYGNDYVYDGSITKTGQAMVYGITVLDNAPNKDLAMKFLDFILS